MTAIDDRTLYRDGNDRRELASSGSIKYTGREQVGTGSCLNESASQSTFTNGLQSERSATRLSAASLNGCSTILKTRRRPTRQDKTTNKLTQRVRYAKTLTASTGGVCIFLSDGHGHKATAIGSFSPSLSSVFGRSRIDTDQCNPHDTLRTTVAQNEISSQEGAT